MASKLDDPQWRRERAAKAGRAAAANTAKLRHAAKITVAVDALVAVASELTPEQVSRLRAVLAPALEQPHLPQAS
jgi:hypothetical protein